MLIQLQCKHLLKVCARLHVHDAQAWVSICNNVQAMRYYAQCTSSQVYYAVKMQPCFCLIPLPYTMLHMPAKYGHGIVTPSILQPKSCLIFQVYSLHHPFANLHAILGIVAGSVSTVQLGLRLRRFDCKAAFSTQRSSLARLTARCMIMHFMPTI